MEQITWVVIAISLCGFMAYNRASLSSFTVAFAALMAIGTFLNVVSFLGWIIFLLLALPLNL